MSELIFLVEEAAEGGTSPARSERRSSPRRRRWKRCDRRYATPCSAISNPVRDRNWSASISSATKSSRH